MRFMPRSRGGALWRFFFAAVIVIGGTAATTAVAGLLQFKQFDERHLAHAAALRTRTSRSRPPGSRRRS